MSFTRVIDFIKFRTKAGNQHSLHSPFVFKLYTEVIRNDKRIPEFTLFEEKRTEHTLDNRKIKVKDFGAKSSHKATRRISSIARKSLKPPRQSRLLYRLVQYFEPKTIIELGTSLGLTTSYIAYAHKDALITTFEGSPAISKLAKRNFKNFRLHNINLVTGRIEEELPKELKTINRLDFVFFDANHQLEPTLEYFKLCLEKAHEDSVFVFDDIYWSDQMKTAWKQIKAHPDVTLTIDLYYIGLVFFRKKQPEQHFKLRF